MTAPSAVCEIPADPKLAGIVRAMRYGKLVKDCDFDAIYPSPVRARAPRYWTPLAVARRAAKLLVTDDATRVLDVGSGAGKFCLVGALTTRGSFTGVEHREPLVELAQALAFRYGAARANYVHGDMRAVDWQRFDAFYFFNPFAENYFRADQFDDTVELSHERFERDTRFAVTTLADARLGTRVATYHGLGADLPATYTRVACELLGTDVLELWVKTT